MDAPRIAARLTLLVALLVFAASGASAQGFQWPEHPKNLKVLPDTISTQELRSTMFSFTSGLGVRCSHCHKGEEGQPLSAYDFASDEKESKRSARVMMLMVKAINESHLKHLDIEDEKRITVTCMTCHRGQNRPRMIEDVLAEEIQTNGIDAAIQKYRDLRERYYGGFTFDFSERMLPGLAQSLAFQGNTDAALKLAALNIEMYPESSTSYYVLGEIHAMRDETDEAISNLEKSLQLDPNNRRAQRRLDQLKGGN